MHAWQRCVNIDTLWEFCIQTHNEKCYIKGQAINTLSYIYVSGPNKQ